MYILKQTVNGKEKANKSYRKLGNAFNAFWKVYNENKVENIDFLSIYNTTYDYNTIEIKKGKLILGM